MRKVKVGTIIENACRLAGRDPLMMGIPDDWRVLAAFAINGAMRRIYAEKLPMLKRIEFRRFRPEWKQELNWQAGHECYHEGKYYRLKNGNGKNPPGASADWECVEFDQIVPFIAFEQPWESTVMDPGGIDKKEFAYREDPKYNPEATPIEGCKWFGEGVIVAKPVPLEGVWVKFSPLAPRFTVEEWDDEFAGYKKGDMVYLTAAKNCYVAKQDLQTTGIAPNTEDGAEYWEAVYIDEAWEDYLTKLVSADFMTNDQGKYQAKAEADREFEAIIDRYEVNVGETMMRRGKFRR